MAFQFFVTPKVKPLWRCYMNLDFVVLISNGDNKNIHVPNLDECST